MFQDSAKKLLDNLFEYGWLICNTKIEEESKDVNRDRAAFQDEINQISSGETI